jgi:hypothetical protein
MAEEMIDANTEFTAFVESCSDNDWRTVCRAEKWRVGVVAHHVAWGHERAADWINAIRRGIPIPGSPQGHLSRRPPRQHAGDPAALKMQRFLG